LQIIHHDTLYIVAAFEPSCLGAKLERRQSRCVVDINWRFGQFRAGIRQLLVMLVAQQASSYLLTVNFADAAQKPFGQLLPAHLQREHSDRSLIHKTEMLGHIQRQTGLSHARPAGDDYHLAVLQSAGQIVKLIIAGG